MDRISSFIPTQEDRRQPSSRPAPGGHLASDGYPLDIIEEVKSRFVFPSQHGYPHIFVNMHYSLLFRTKCIISICQFIYCRIFRYLNPLNLRIMTNIVFCSKQPTSNASFVTVDPRCQQRSSCHN